MSENNNIIEIRSEMKSFNEEVTNHMSMLNTVSDSLQNAINTELNEIAKLNEDNNKLIENNNQLETMNKDLEKSIQNNKLTIEQLEPKGKNLKNNIAEITKNVENLKYQIDKKKVSIENLEMKVNNLKTELQEKEKSKNELDASIEEKVKLNNNDLLKVKEEFKAMKNKYQVWDYLVNKIEFPEVEILATIAANRGIKTDNIKSKTKSVQPVVVGRTIAKLEADGKIVPTSDNGWDISPSILEKIS